MAAVAAVMSVSLLLSGCAALEREMAPTPKVNPADLPTVPGPPTARPTHTPTTIAKATSYSCRQPTKKERLIMTATVSKQPEKVAAVSLNDEWAVILWLANPGSPYPYDGIITNAVRFNWLGTGGPEERSTWDGLYKQVDLQFEGGAQAMNVALDCVKRMDQ